MCFPICCSHFILCLLIYLMVSKVVLNLKIERKEENINKLRLLQCRRWISSCGNVLILGSFGHFLRDPLFVFWAHCSFPLIRLDSSAVSASFNLHSFKVLHPCIIYLTLLLIGSTVLMTHAIRTWVNIITDIMLLIRLFWTFHCISISFQAFVWYPIVSTASWHFAFDVWVD